MDNLLLSNLRQAGKKTEFLRLENGSEVLLLAQGGRILGLFAPGDEANFYWTNPSLMVASEARRFLDSAQWQNTGGDRTWLAPENAFFFPDFPDLTNYHQPRQFDASDYELERLDGTASLRIEFEIKHAKQELPIRVRLGKTIEPVANPLRYEAVWKRLDKNSVCFAGYGVRSSIEFASFPPPGVPVGLWQLIQMPHGGEMFLPTYGQPEAKVVFGNIPSEDLRPLPTGGFRYKMTAPGAQKISLRAASCTGRMGYLYKSQGRWQLVVRNVFMNPSGEYVDAPWTEPDDVGYGVQACNVNGKWGNFSELEYHAPAIGVPRAPQRSDDFAQIWAFRGMLTDMALILKELLGAEVPAGLYQE